MTDEERTLVDGLNERLKEDVVRIDYDDQPNEVAVGFAKVLQNFGIEVEEVWPADDLPSAYYILTKKT
jgi:hypothetical protein